MAGPDMEHFWVENGSAKKEVVSQAELICAVALQEDALTQGSLETLASLGIPATARPRRDSALPPRM